MDHDTMTTASLLESIWLLRHEPTITGAMRLAETVAVNAAMAADATATARVLATLLDDGDDLVALAALHALAGVADPVADDELVNLLLRGRPPFAGHAAWVLAARRPSPAAVAELIALHGRGSFSGMLAERTLIEWARAGSAETLDALWTANRDAHDRAEHRLAAAFESTLAAIPGSGMTSAPAQRDHLSAARIDHDPDGIVIVQPFLHARLDADGTSLGSGDAGGIASLLRSLGNAMGVIDGVAEVITVTRATVDADGDGRSDQPQSEWIGPNHRVERIAFGPAGRLPWREAWSFRTLLEREFTAIGEQLAGRRVVWHLRMADVGTLAAAAAARRLGQPIVFTSAPDPHIVIDSQEANGQLSRAQFAIEDASSQYWFRARMVERLSAQVDRLALLPRPTIKAELIELLGLDPQDLERRSVVVPEGVDVAAIDRAERRDDATVCATRPCDAVAGVLSRMPAHRRNLPWILSVGRLSQLKGPHRIVEAVLGDAGLSQQYNVVLVGGDLANPSPDERSTLDLVHAATARFAHPEAVTVVGHMPPDAISDLLVHASRHAGLYVCASDKEEFGLAIVEALAAGLVVVAPERGGPRTYVDDGINGVLCNTSSMVALRGAVLRSIPLIDDPVRAAAARSAVRATLSVEHMAARLYSLYCELMPVAAARS